MEYIIRNNFAKINIYYEIKQYDSIKQVALDSFLSLISNIGGHLGLWIGMSTLTILELIECFYDILKHMCAALIIRRKNTLRKENTTSGPVRQTQIAFQNDDAFSYTARP
ncbi:acid-sensing ion channel 4-A-like [Anneissia japonica]|uniref:acid-sensing ion channel 4-A-like n=1 Tax=Anneissia japonica TaxID=1529436 RepID=UPI0014255571|nr:acid-sensing ion channel 4-A-like [Anneissia japonica]